MDTAAMALGFGLGGNLGARVLGSNVGGAYMSNALTPELLKRLLMLSLAGCWRYGCAPIP